jgi:hypothetical protein
MMAQHKVDFRRQLDGLLAEAYLLGANPYAGDCVLFVKRDMTQLRVLVGDKLGLYLISRRFEGGRLRALLAFAAHPTTKTITHGELSLLLEGATFTVHTRTRPWRQKASRRAQEGGGEPPSPLLG